MFSCGNLKMKNVSLWLKFLIPLGEPCVWDTIPHWIPGPDGRAGARWGRLECRPVGAKGNC